MIAAIEGAGGEIAPAVADGHRFGNLLARHHGLVGLPMEAHAVGGMEDAVGARNLESPDVIVGADPHVGGVDGHPCLAVPEVHTLDGG